MAAQKLPVELLGRIIGFMESTTSARLICQLWNILAIPRAFRTITLKPTGRSYKGWGALTENVRVENAVHEVLIYSHDPAEETDFMNRVPPEFTMALQKIHELQYLEKITVRFSPRCFGPESIQSELCEHEWYKKRVNVFELVFNAIQTRSHLTRRTRIRSFRVENMQNAPLFTFTSSNVFNSVIKDLEEVHLHVIQEYDEIDRQHNAFTQLERVTFEPWLQENWLMPMANNLRSLSLCFADNWGTAPGTFNGRGLAFPHLKSLHLRCFIISHYDHFDWVLNQTILETLRLEDCSIATVLRFGEGMDLWGPDTHDWEPIPEGTFGNDWGEIFFFSGTWEFIFDNIRARLSGLVAFEFLPESRDIDGLNSSTEQITALYETRYTVRA
ncbi:unnamed protein product [Clonostachys rosea]|uniref:F-box domain-containing protein n=1 Tax=Bionectria ochroleuca TaxID=29856 RepID=A0ABY6UAE0_BIOOC|nr:unnamed protein product [Clonostachys rosea]